MHTKKLVRIGNSHGLILDRAILDLLDITPETELEVKTDGKSLVIRPAAPGARHERFKDALARTMKNHRGTLKRLAK
jgi:antitoxin component of MazEF toxin-antitoxin module